MDWFSGAGLWWLIAALLLGIAELLIPGVFLIFIAIAAAIIGVVTLLFPELGLAGQFGGFVIWTIVTVLIGKRWYRDYPVDTLDPKLNDRVARLIGETVEVTQAIENGHGRVRVGDGEWPAHGPDIASGARVRVVGADDGVLRVEPVPPALS
ncbi:NfeD family protein [Stakelama sediminis]|uniref:NfeD-like C-terminal domain-containing protein n=1 Tax=Stakelama sediminis TaxID=463200 RepID=A0A840YYM0_9SPHN|nr:NfeD family protein [Stakelama sediminis]MBB5718881.1 hypothetical protein [Stakelama sediminis]